MNINPGDKVTTIDPRSKKKVTGTVRWVSPTKKSYTVVLPDGYIAYDYPAGVDPIESMTDFMGAPASAFMDV